MEPDHFWRIKRPGILENAISDRVYDALLLTSILFIPFLIHASVNSLLCVSCHLVSILLNHTEHQFFSRCLPQDLETTSLDC